MRTPALLTSGAVGFPIGLVCWRSTIRHSGDANIAGRQRAVRRKGLWNNSPGRVEFVPRTHIYGLHDFQGLSHICHNRTLEQRATQVMVSSSRREPLAKVDEDLL